MKLDLQSGESARQVRVLRRGDSLRVSLEDGRTVDVPFTRAADGEISLRLGGRTVRLRGASLGPADRQLWVDGRTLAYRRLLGGRPAGGAPAPDAGSLGASIPSVVVDVLVAPGDAVEAGDKLLLLESMKMVIPILAPRDGTVTAVHCAKGDAVQPGRVLVELGP